MIELNSYIRHREELLTQVASDTLVIFNLDDGQYYALEGVGGKIWELCDGTNTAAEVISALCEEYNAPYETVEKDVLVILEELVYEKLAVECNERA